MSKKQWISGLLFFLLSPWLLFSLEMQPWFGDVYEFHFLGSYAYSQFDAVDNARPPYHQHFHSNLVYLGLDFSPSSVWSVDSDVRFADTTASSFYFQSVAMQARYLWSDDIIGDSVSLATGGSVRFTPSHALTDVSCPSFSHLDFEAHFSLGKEFDAASEIWRWRLWVFGAVGHGTKGSPWVRGLISWEANHEDQHKFALYVSGINAYGRHTHIDVENFSGYGKIREKAIDIGVRYGYTIGVWGTLRLEYMRRVLAKSAPQNVNTFMIGYLLPFAL